MTLLERKKVSRIQGLIGIAMNAHLNDRDQNHIQAVEKPLKEAFNECVKILGKYPPVEFEQAGRKGKP